MHYMHIHKHTHTHTDTTHTPTFIQPVCLIPVFTHCHLSNIELQVASTCVYVSFLPYGPEPFPSLHVHIRRKIFGLILTFIYRCASGLWGVSSHWCDSEKRNLSCRHKTFSRILIILMLVMRILRQSTRWEVFPTQFLPLMSQSAPAKLHIWKRSMWQPSAMWKSQGKYSSVRLLLIPASLYETRTWMCVWYWFKQAVFIPALCCVPAVPSACVLGIILVVCFLLHFFICQTWSDILYICFSVRKTETLGQFEVRMCAI